MTIALKTLPELYALWDQLGDVPTVYEGEHVDEIEEPFIHFPVGTHRETIWHWFEAQNPQFLVGEVMQGILHDPYVAPESAPANPS